ncbi:hypothetical protein GAYE_PCTG33G0936 [Galdieria yellowstonensis]|uniref:Spindle pole body component n=1 Tax=Galdieria yellowstonensis TaxID=3028027 RepID=A0AAV9I3M2_9RHOD|nr:hypothetical protein GAYE_PCTG33G0936 [Galdieria yellowstonensis]
MIFDLLYALVGYTGNVIIRKENNQNAKRTSEKISFQLASDFPYVTPSERRAIDRISNIGALYTIVYEYVHGSGLSNHSKTKSLYILAIQKALDEILDEYRQLIASYEEEAIHKRLQNLSLVEAELRIWERRFEDLCRLFDKIEEVKSQKGPQLIIQLIQFCTCGAPDTASLCMRLLKKCVKVLLVQLQTWLYYGELQDPYEEFFLRRASRDTLEQQQQPHDDDPFLFLVDDVVMAQENFTPLFTLAMVRDVLFIGGVVKTLRNSEEASSQVDWNELETQLEGLRCLEMQPLSSLPLESKIQLTRQWASKQLMRLLFRVSWWKEFEFLRQTFLLGRGELWSHFLRDTCDLFMIPPMKESKESVLNMFLEKSLLKTFFEVDYRYELLSFQRLYNSTSESDSSTAHLLALSSGWTRISLSYVPRKPLHILMSTKDLQHYSRIFCIVFAVAHVRFQMERCWFLLRNVFKECNRVSLVKHRNTLQLLRMCNFCIHCIEEFFQIDLIEESFENFMKQARGASDFDTVHLLHRKYLDTLVHHTLIYSASFMESLDSLLQVFREYCLYIQHKFIEDKAIVQELSTERQEHSMIHERILSFLQELQKYPNHPVNTRLLKRIDFNNFFLESVVPTTTTVLHSYSDKEDDEE